MLCPKCRSSQSVVADSRQRVARINTVYRRRHCLDCGTRWKTYEIDEAAYASLVSNDKTLRSIFAFAEKLQANVQELTTAASCQNRER